MPRKPHALARYGDLDFSYSSEYQASEASVLGGEALLVTIIEPEWSWSLPVIRRRLPRHTRSPQYQYDLTTVNGYVSPLVQGSPSGIGQRLAATMREEACLSAFARLSPFNSTTECSAIPKAGSGGSWTSEVVQRGTTVSIDTSGTVDDIRRGMRPSDRNRLNKLARTMSVEMHHPDAEVID